MFVCLPHNYYIQWNLRGVPGRESSWRTENETISLSLGYGTVRVRATQVVLTQERCQRPTPRAVTADLALVEVLTSQETPEVSMITEALSSTVTILSIVLALQMCSCFHQSHAGERCLIYNVLLDVII